MRASFCIVFRELLTRLCMHMYMYILARNKHEIKTKGDNSTVIRWPEYYHRRGGGGGGGEKNNENVFKWSKMM